MQDSAHLSFEEKHDSAGAVESVHEYDLNAFFALLIQVNPVLLVHFEVDDEAAQGGEAINDKLLGQIARVDLAMVPIVAQAPQVILVAVTEEVAVACFVLLPVLKIVHSDVWICDVTHLVLLFLLFLLLLIINNINARFFV